MTRTTMINQYEQYLAHHGIPGQKWGVRRYQNSDGTLTDAGRKRYNKSDASFKKRAAKVASEHVKTKRQQRQQNPAKHKRASQMTDAELNKRIERLQLEKKYKDLKNDMDPAKNGKKVVSDIATKAITNIGTQALTYAIGSAVNKLLHEKKVTKVKNDKGETVDKVEFVDIVNPRKGQKDK